MCQGLREPKPKILATLTQLYDKYLQLRGSGFDLERIMDPKILEDEERFKSYISKLNDHTNIFRKNFIQAALEVRFLISLILFIGEETWI